MNFNKSSTLNQSKSTFLDMSMGRRLQEALDRRDRTPPDVIAATKLSKGGVYNILNDDTQPDKVRELTVEKICSFLRISRAWLVWGKGGMDDVDVPDDLEWPNVIGVRVAAALGEGIEPDDYAETHKLKFRAESLARKKLDPEKLAVVYGKGDSMYPTIKDGDAILFDRRDTTPRKGKLYVVTYDKGLCAKRLNLLGGRWFLESDNQNDPKWHDPILIDEVKGFEIHGRVRWIGSWED